MKAFSRSLVIFLFTFSNFIFAENVEKIEISGLDKISRGTVLNYLAIEVNDDIDEGILKSSYESLNKTGLFSKIDLTFSNGLLKAIIIENPTIKYVDFKNYKEDEVLNNETIENLKLNHKINEGNFFNKVNLENLLSNLKALYESNAYFQTKLRVSSEVDDKNRIGLVFDIHEGEKSLIRSFKISGVTVFEKSEIIELFDIGEPDFFLINYFTEKDSFSKKSLDAGIESVITKYNQIGYLDFKVNKIDIKNTQKDNYIDINIDFFEGPQYKVGKVFYTGDKSRYSIDYLNSLIKLKIGDVFKRNEIVKSVNQITKIFQNDGYAFVSVNLNAKKRKDENVLDLHIDIDTNSKVYLNRIEISGNHRTQDDVVRRQLKLNESQIYSKIDIDESIKKIKRLGYFSNVDYSLVRLKDFEDKVNLVINVIEAKTGEFSIGLSHSNDTGAALNLGISQKNILGTGNTLNASFSNSSAVEDLSVYFLDPHFNKDGHSISYGFFDKKVNASDLDASTYVLNESGLNFGYGVPVSEFSRIFGEFRLSSVDLTCGSSLKNFDEVAQCANNDNLDATISLKYTKNNLNDFFYPTEGSETLLKTILGLPIADFNYYQLSSSYRSYEPIFDGKTFKFSSRLKVASGYGGKDLPFYKRFYEGGSSSIRGFDFNSLGERYSTSDLPKGGELSFVSSVGLSTPLNFMSINNPNIKASTFVDAGMVSSKASSPDFGDIRSSAGVGFDWITPIGPIGVHYAVPIVKKTNDKTKNFSFELGSSF